LFAGKSHLFASKSHLFASKSLRFAGKKAPPRKTKKETEADEEKEWSPRTGLGRGTVALVRQYAHTIDLLVCHDSDRFGTQEQRGQVMRNLRLATGTEDDTLWKWCCRQRTINPDDVDEAPNAAGALAESLLEHGPNDFNLAAAAAEDSPFEYGDARSATTDADATWIQQSLPQHQRVSMILPLVTKECGLFIDRAQRLVALGESRSLVKMKVGTQKEVVGIRLKEVTDDDEDAQTVRARPPPHRQRQAEGEPSSRAATGGGCALPRGAS
jgi:hypothetical protein